MFDSINRRDFIAAAGGVAMGGASVSSVAGRETPITNDDTGSEQSVSSPDGAVEVEFGLRDGTPEYSVSFDDDTLIEPSPLGFEFADMDALDSELAVTGCTTESVDETWEPVWGTTDEIRNHYNELAIGLEETNGPNRALTVVFRVFDDGVGFRYVLPEQDAMDKFVITSENTGFRFAEDYTTWWIPDDYDSYEYLYEETPLSEIAPLDDQRENATDADGVNTPVTMRTADDVHLSVHEAALTDYAGMTLTRVDDDPTAFESTLVPLPDGSKVKAETPHATPWRTVQLGREAGDLIESNLIVNLNEPAAIEDTDWIRPGKYMGIWWEIHIGKSTWVPGPDVGATTENAKRYIDFASSHGIPMLLVEGWNVGWEGGFEAWSNPPETFDFTRSIDQYDLEEVVEYGNQQDPPVDIVMHNETGGGVSNYEEQLDEAYDLYERLDIPAIKSGYVSEEGLRVDSEIYHHHSQRMVNHYEMATRKAAEHEIMLNVHEPIKPTGERRTYPNLMTREGVSGLEYENFREEGNPPAHTVTIPFTRMLGGPLDYTPGIFDVLYPEYGETRVHDTVARQLALYPMLFSGLQMVADLPEKYDDLDLFEYIERVPASWDETVVVNGSIGEYATIARRSGGEWYVGSGTGETPRTLEIPLEFLDGGPYVVAAHTDGAEADLETNPMDVKSTTFLARPDETIHASMVTGGGQALRITPVSEADANPSELSEYRPPEYEYDTLLVPYGVAAGDPTVVSVEVTNPGSVVGGETLALYVDGEQVDSTIARVPAESERQIDFPLRLLEGGDHELGVGPAGEGPVLSKPTTVEAPSEEFEWFEYHDFTVPEQAEVDEEVEITVDVENTGDELSIQVLKLTVDDALVEAQQVSLDAGASETFTFTHAFDRPGTYEVALEDLGAREIEAE